MRQRGADEPEWCLALGVAGNDPVDAVFLRAGPEARIAFGKILLASPRARWQQDVLFVVDLAGVELDRVVRVDAREVVAPYLHRAAAVGLVRRDEIGDVEFALAR